MNPAGCCLLWRWLPRVRTAAAQHRLGRTAAKLPAPRGRLLLKGPEQLLTHRLSQLGWLRQQVKRQCLPARLLLCR